MTTSPQESTDAKMVKFFTLPGKDNRSPDAHGDDGPAVNKVELDKRVQIQDLWRLLPFRLREKSILPATMDRQRRKPRPVHRQQSARVRFEISADQISRVQSFGLILCLPARELSLAISAARDPHVQSLSRMSFVRSY